MPSNVFPRPFRISVPDEVLVDLKQRLALTRWPDESPDRPWQYGTSLSYMRELTAYWQNQYDWRVYERLLNSFNQYTVNIDDIDLHYIYVPGVGPDPLPLIISHGWPGSVYEFVKIIGPLTDPARYGGVPEDAFSVVAPSLPGFGFSPLSCQKRLSLEQISNVFARLMTDVLGFSHFGAQGGDWGAMITSRLGFDYDEKIVGIHLNMMNVIPPQDARKNLSPKERSVMNKVKSIDDELGYQWIQGTKPQTLSYGLNDSPVGLAAWIVEKFYFLTDCHGELERSISKDDVLSNIMIYWITQTINSSFWLYYWLRHTPWRLQSGERVNVPTGFAAFPAELFTPPREWVERVYNLKEYTLMESGGHFAALEKPDELVADIRAFFRKLR